MCACFLSTIRRSFQYVVVANLLAATSVLATDLTWTGAVSSDWNNPTNWMPQQVPTASDDVFINSGSVTIPVDGVFAIMDWTGGSISGALTVASNGVLNIEGNVYVDGALTNAGTVNWTAGSVNMAYANSDGGPIVNLADGTWNIQCDQSLSTTYGGGYPNYPNAYFLNEGLVLKTAASGTTQFGYGGYYGVFFENGGKVEAQEGTINFEGGYSDTSSADLAISLGGATPGSGYGSIRFSTPIVLNGMLTATARNGFQPINGETFDNVLIYPSSTGAFSCIDLDLGNGFLLQPKFSNTGLTLFTVTYTVGSSLPQLFISASENNVTVQWPLGFPDWTLESTTNLESPIWMPVSTTCENEAVVPMSGPQQYYELQSPLTLPCRN
jgi:hypothetical protein